MHFVNLDACAFIDKLPVMSNDTHPPSEAVVTVWIRLMRSQQAALMRIERAFRSAKMHPLAWYDALWELDRAGEAGLRPFEIERRVLVAQSNISRLIDRLQAAGLVQRRACEGDGRGQVVCITASGRTMRAQMWSVYAAAIEACVGAHISEADAKALAALLGKLPDGSA